MFVEELRDAVVQRGLIALDGQHVVGAAVDDRAGDFGLAAHGVDRHQSPGKLEHFEQFGDGRDLVALGVDDDLPQGNQVDRGPGADHVDGRLATGGVETAAQRLAIDGDELAVGDFVQRGDPAQ